MKEEFINYYPRIVRPLLCLFMMLFFSCSSLKNTGDNALIVPQRILQVAVKESDFEIFNQSIHELGLMALDFRIATTNMSDNGDREYHITFRFASQDSFASGCSALISTGVVRRMSYPYRE